MESKDQDPFYVTLGIGCHPPADLNMLKEQGDKDINDLKCKVESGIGNLQNSETQKYFGDLISDFQRVFGRYLFTYLKDGKTVFVIFARTMSCKGVHGFQLVMEQVMKGDRNGQLYSPQTIFVSLSEAFKLQPTGAHVKHMIGLKMICVGDRRYAVSP